MNYISDKLKKLDPCYLKLRYHDLQDSGIKTFKNKYFYYTLSEEFPLITASSMIGAFYMSKNIEAVPEPIRPYIVPIVGGLSTLPITMLFGWRFSKAREMIGYKKQNLSNANKLEEIVD